MKGIDTSIATVAAAVEEQKAVTQEISRHSSQAAAAVSSVSNSVAKVDDAAKQTDGGTKQVSAAATALSNHSQSLLRQIGEFTERLRLAA